MKCVLSKWNCNDTLRLTMTKHVYKYIHLIREGLAQTHHQLSQRKAPMLSQIWVNSWARHRGGKPQATQAKVSQVYNNGTAGKRKLAVAKVKWSEIECQLGGMRSWPQTNWVYEATAYIRTYAHMHARTYVCTYACMYARMYAVRNAKMSELLSELMIHLMHLLVRCYCRTKHVCCVEW